MAHELSIRKNSTAEMAYVGETPWHGLGQKLAAGASIEEWKAAAGFDWNILRAPVQFAAGTKSEDGDGGFGAVHVPNMKVYDERHVLYRSDNKLPLSVVSKDYEVVQPGVMLEFFRDLVASAGFVLDTAGMLFDGKRMWVLARVTDDAVIVGRDTVGGYLLLSTACDGSMATTGRFITIRVVCNNTLSMALNQDTKTLVKINHSSKFDPERMKNSLGIGRGQFEKFIGAARALSKDNIGGQDAKDFVAKLLIDTKTVTSKGDVQVAVRDSEAYGRILRLFNGAGAGADMAGSQGTAWGLVNAVTQYVDHHSAARTTSNRLNRAWFGKGDELKTASLEMALAL